MGVLPGCPTPPRDTDGRELSPRDRLTNGDFCRNVRKADVPFRSTGPGQETSGRRVRPFKWRWDSTSDQPGLSTNALQCLAGPSCSVFFGEGSYDAVAILDLNGLSDYIGLPLVAYYAPEGASVPHFCIIPQDGRYDELKACLQDKFIEPKVPGLASQYGKDARLQEIARNQDGVVRVLLVEDAGACGEHIAESVTHS